MILHRPITATRRNTNTSVLTTPREVGRSLSDLDARQGRREDPRQAHPEAERTLTMERSAHARPPLAVDEQHIPPELQQSRQWLELDLQMRNGDPIKTPHSPAEPCDHAC